MAGILVVGVIAGLGYAFISTRPASSPMAQTPSASSQPSFTATPTATPTPTPSPTPSPTPTATPSASPSASPTAPSGPPPGTIPVGCGPLAPGQHGLDPVPPPDANHHADPSLDWSGCGTFTVPGGSGRFTIGDDWLFAESHTCPNGSAGSGGMGVTITVTEQVMSGSPPDPPFQLVGDYGSSVSGDPSRATKLNAGGNYQLKVEPVNSDCIWHIAAYPHN